ncbi:hypothetical protein [Streptomyces sp. NPDC051704]|uniref:hypothetical protein n=1 Tax=Streptomyces sp. NPDC051704 TaxID=3365671 RepID=UPI0037BD7E47
MTETQSTTFKVTASEIRNSGHPMLPGFPTKILDISKKDGSVHFPSVDIVMGKKYEKTHAAGASVDVPAGRAAD